MPGGPNSRPPFSLVTRARALIDVVRGGAPVADPSIPPPPRLSILPRASVPPGQPAPPELKTEIADLALDLLEEQVQARIVHYKAELETNPELDAITAQVVAQLRELQASVAPAPRHAADGELVRELHEKTLRTLLERVFRRDAPSLLLDRRLKEIHKKLARLFFQSELHEKTASRDGASKLIQHGEQAVFYVLARYEHRLRAELDAFEYGSVDAKEHALQLLERFEKEMQDAFLARRSSELRRIIAGFHAILIDFFCAELAPLLPEFASIVIRSAETWRGRAVAHKIGTDAFPRFRAAFERELMHELVGTVEDRLIERLADTSGGARDETLAFVTDPRVFSTIVGEIGEGVYDFLCTEGFLDLPLDWRQTLSGSSTS